MLGGAKESYLFCRSNDLILIWEREPSVFMDAASTFRRARENGRMACLN